MPITKASRQAIYNQALKANPAAKESLEQLLDDSNPLAGTFEQMFMARSDHSRAMNELQSLQAQVAQARTANEQWKATQEAHIQNIIRQAQQQTAQAQTMAKVAVEKLTGALTKAQSGETLYPQDLMVDSSLTAFAATAPATAPTAPPANPHLSGFDQPSGAFQQQPASAASQIDPDQFIAKMTGAVVNELGTLEQLRYQHYELFGAPLDAAYLIQQAQRTGRPVTEIYAETYNPEAKRAEKAQADFDTRVQAAVDEKLKALAANGDPSGQSNSLAALGMLTGANNPHRSVALEASGPEWTAAKLDPSFAARNGMPPVPGQPSSPPAGGALPPIPSAPKGFMDNMATWEADMMQGALEGRGNNQQFKLV